MPKRAAVPAPLHIVDCGIILVIDEILAAPLVSGMLSSIAPGKALLLFVLLLFNKDGVGDSVLWLVTDVTSSGALGVTAARRPVGAGVGGEGDTVGAAGGGTG